MLLTVQWERMTRFTRRMTRASGICFLNEEKKFFCVPICLCDFTLFPNKKKSKKPIKFRICKKLWNLLYLMMHRPNYSHPIHGQLFRVYYCRYLHCHLSLLLLLPSSPLPHRHLNSMHHVQHHTYAPCTVHGQFVFATAVFSAKNPEK